MAFIVLNAVLGIAVAIFLNEVRGKLATRFYQSIMLVPFLISWVVVSYLAYAFLATDTGFINNSILEPLGLQPISWYTEAEYWPAILIFVQVWKSIGFQCVIYYSSLISISTDYYERPPDYSFRYRLLLRNLLFFRPEAQGGFTDDRVKQQKHCW